jgi:hypothetical protein
MQGHVTVSLSLTLRQPYSHTSSHAKARTAVLMLIDPLWCFGAGHKHVEKPLFGGVKTRMLFLPKEWS